MPSRPPKFKVGIAQPKPKAWQHSKRQTTTQRGYGWTHQKMRAVVLIEEPLCRWCLADGRVSASTIADHIKPLAEGGTGDRENYQGLCGDCSDIKTASESARAQLRGKRS